MTDTEKRSLKSYLTNCLEPALASAKVQAADYYKADGIHSNCGNFMDAQAARGMTKWALGKVSALEMAIEEFKELFAEELADTEEE